MSIVDKNRFKDGHYIGLPASHNDLFVKTRAELVRQIPNFIGNDLSMVDIGCGNGNTVVLLAKEFQNCTGVDIFPENKVAFEQTCSEQDLQNCQILLMNVEEEVPDQKFDRLICFEVIEHFKSEKTVRRFKHFLKPGGKIAITVPHKWWLLETHGAKLPLLPWNRVPFFSWLPRPLHERWANARIYTKKRIVRLLEDSGFEVKEAKLMTAPLDVMKDSPLKRFLKKYIFRGKITNNPFLATNVFVWAELKQ
mgnify:FL=1